MKRVTWAFLVLCLAWPSVLQAAELTASRAISLTAGNPSIKSPTVALDPLTSSISVTLQRPTTAVPLPNWTATGKVRVTLVLSVDGQEHRIVGTTSGGVRSTEKGEVDTYSLVYRPTVLFAQRARDYLITHPADGTGTYHNVPLTRIGETGSVVTGYLLLERMSGRIDTVVKVARTTAAPAPVLATYHNSVAFDAATSAQEVSGDGLLSLTHTSAGSNRAVFAGYGGWASSASTSMTYDGVSMTEIWNITDAAYNDAGYGLAGQSTTAAATVTSDLVCGACNHHGIGVISMTGVDQTTPYGSAVSGSGGATSPSVTVLSVNAGDLVIDNVFTEDVGCTAVGANQTQRNDEVMASDTTLCQSTQSGADGGVMSWGAVGTTWWSTAVAFKENAGTTSETFGFRRRVAP